MQSFFRQAVQWYNLSHEFVLPFLGVIDVPELGGICMVSPWMENSDARQFLDKRVQSGDLVGSEYLKAVNKLVSSLEGLVCFRALISS